MTDHPREAAALWADIQDAPEPDAAVIVPELGEFGAPEPHEEDAQ